MQNQDDTPSSATERCSTSSSSTKSSKYREMVARTDSSQWRGAARSKVEAAIVDGADTELNLQQQENTTILLGPEADEQRLEEENLGSSQVADEEEHHSADKDCDSTADQQDKGTKLEDDDTNIEDGVPDDLDDVPLQDETDAHGNKEEGSKEEDEISVIYKSWESQEDDETVGETVLDDVELGVESELADHIGEVELDTRAFDKIKASEKEERRKRRHNRCYYATLCIAFLAIILLTSWVIVAIINGSNSDDKEPTISEPAPLVAFFTGSMAPLQEPEIGNGINDRVIVNFPVNMLVPEGSSVSHRVYDGPDCSSFGGGANDITGMDNYVKAGLYGAGPMQKNQEFAEKMGLFLQWDQDQVLASPLYTRWAGVVTTNPAAIEGAADPFYGTMDLCVSLSILDPQGERVHYMETYLLTTWLDTFLEKVRAIPHHS